MTLKLLSGIRVLELAIELPGAQAPSILADLGAQVIKIEPPPVGDYQREVWSIKTPKPGPRHAGIGVSHLAFNRNKRSLALDLKQEEGREVFYELLKDTDIVFDLSIPGSRAKLGVDYESCKQRKPDIVYVSLSGFGQNGPYAPLPSHGYAAPALLGNVGVEANDDGTFALGPPSGGGGAPAIAAIAMLAGLAHRNATGEGVYLDTSLVDPGVYSNFLGFFSHFNPKHPYTMPGVGSARYTAYKTKDDKFLLFMPLERKFWERFCTAIDRPDLAARYGSEGTEMDYGAGDTGLAQDLTELFKTRTRKEWVQVCLEAKVPGTPLGTFEDLLEDEEFMTARELVTTYHDPRLNEEVALASFPIRRPGVRFEVERPAPDVGQHNDEILTELGYSDAKREDLRQKGVVFGV